MHAPSGRLLNSLLVVAALAGLSQAGCQRLSANALSADGSGTAAEVTIDPKQVMSVARLPGDGGDTPDAEDQGVAEAPNSQGESQKNPVTLTSTASPLASEPGGQARQATQEQPQAIDTADTADTTGTGAAASIQQGAPGRSGDTPASQRARDDDDDDDNQQRGRRGENRDRGRGKGRSSGQAPNGRK
jgi:hypothetical protein